MPFVEEDLEDYDDSELIKELDDILWEIYQSYLLDDEKKFRDSIKKVLIENGYKP
jgi:hypothetical protein